MLAAATSAGVGADSAGGGGGGPGLGFTLPLLLAVGLRVDCVLELGFARREDDNDVAFFSLTCASAPACSWGSSQLFWPVATL